MKLMKNLIRFLEDSIGVRFLKAEEEAAGCRDDDEEPNGANAESGPTDTPSSGLGGLGLEGIVVGKEEEEDVGEGTTPPEEGIRGATSGDNSVDGDSAEGKTSVGAGAGDEDGDGDEDDDECVLGIGISNNFIRGW